MQDTIITIQGRNYKASECVAQLATARAKVAKGIILYRADVDKFSASLASAGIAEDATFAADDIRSMYDKGRDAAVAARRNMVGSKSGDINDLLARSGCSAACDD